MKNFFSLLCSTLSSSSLSSAHKSSHQRCSIEKLVFLATFTGKHMCWSHFLTKFLTNFIKKRVQQLFSCEYWGILKKTYFEEHLRTTASVDNLKTFYLQYFDFMSNTVCVICIVLIITLSGKVKTKICLLGQLQVALQKKIQNEKEFSSLVYCVRSYRTFHEIRKLRRKHH